VTIRQVDDPAELVELFSPDPVIHLYGLPDLEEPYWSNSRWYRRGDASVGVVSDGGGGTFGYAMSATAPDATIALLGEVHQRMAPHTWVTGPEGLATGMDGQRALDPKGSHVRMILSELKEPPIRHEVDSLTRADVDAVDELIATDPGAAFQRASMLDQGTWHGVWEGDVLVACAGTHVLSERHGVAAIGGVMTRPTHRGRGLGAAVTVAVCRAVRGRVSQIGLNVSAGNRAAMGLYERLGFRPVLTYEEIELL